MTNFQSLSNISNSILEVLDANSVAPLTKKFDETRDAKDSAKLNEKEEIKSKSDSPGIAIQ